MNWLVDGPSPAHYQEFGLDIATFPNPTLRVIFAYYTVHVCTCARDGAL